MEVIKCHRRAISACAVLSLLIIGGPARADGSDTFFDALKNDSVGDYVKNKVKDYVVDHLPEWAKDAPPANYSGIGAGVGNAVKTGVQTYDIQSEQMQLVQNGVSDFSNDDPDSTALTALLEDKPGTKWMQDTVKDLLPAPIGNAITAIDEAGGLGNYLKEKAGSADSWVADTAQAARDSASSKLNNLKNKVVADASDSTNAISKPMISTIPDERRSVSQALKDDDGAVVSQPLSSARRAELEAADARERQRQEAVKEKLKQESLARQAAYDEQQRLADEADKREEAREAKEEAEAKRREDREYNALRARTREVTQRVDDHMVANQIAQAKKDEQERQARMDQIDRDSQTRAVLRAGSKSSTGTATGTTTCTPQPLRPCASQ
jgi:hypothetical protein